MNVILQLKIQRRTLIFIHKDANLTIYNHSPGRNGANCWARRLADRYWHPPQVRDSGDAANANLPPLLLGPKPLDCKVASSYGRKTEDWKVNS